MLQKWKDHNFNPAVIAIKSSILIFFWWNLFYIISYQFPHIIIEQLHKTGYNNYFYGLKTSEIWKNNIFRLDVPVVNLDQISWNFTVLLVKSNTNCKKNISAKLNFEGETEHPNIHTYIHTYIYIYIYIYVY